jgi:hypothetical protein
MALAGLNFFVVTDSRLTSKALTDEEVYPAISSRISMHEGDAETRLAKPCVK